MSAETGEDVTIPPAFAEGSETTPKAPKAKSKAKPKAKRKTKSKAKTKAVDGEVTGVVTKKGRGKIFTGSGMNNFYDWKDEISLPVKTAEALEAKGWFEIND